MVKYLLEYSDLNKVAGLLGACPNTVRDWDKDGALETKQIVRTGTSNYEKSKSDTLKFLDEKVED